MLCQMKLHVLTTCHHTLGFSELVSGKKKYISHPLCSLHVTQMMLSHQITLLVRETLCSVMSIIKYLMFDYLAISYKDSDHTIMIALVC